MSISLYIYKWNRQQWITRLAEVQFGTAAPISTTGYAMEPMPYTVDGGAYTIQGSAFKGSMA